MPICRGENRGHVRIFLCFASRYAAMNVFARSLMLWLAGGGVVRREHDQKPEQVHGASVFILCSCYSGYFLVEIEHCCTE